MPRTASTFAEVMEWNRIDALVAIKSETPEKPNECAVYHNGKWCRYCGAKSTSQWRRGPWGKNTLCNPHYVQVYQKNNLDLSGWVEMPTEPINSKENTQCVYETRMKKRGRD